MALHSPLTCVDRRFLHCISVGVECCAETAAMQCLAHKVKALQMNLVENWRFSYFKSSTRCLLATAILHSLSQLTKSKWAYRMPISWMLLCNLNLLFELSCTLWAHLLQPHLSSSIRMRHVIGHLNQINLLDGKLTVKVCITAANAAVKVYQMVWWTHWLGIIQAHFPGVDDAHLGPHDLMDWSPSFASLSWNWHGSHTDQDCPDYPCCWHAAASRIHRNPSLPCLHQHCSLRDAALALGIAGVNISQGNLACQQNATADVTIAELHCTAISCQAAVLVFVVQLLVCSTTNSNRALKAQIVTAWGKQHQR